MQDTGDVVLMYSWCGVYFDSEYKLINLLMCVLNLNLMINRGI